MTNINESGPPPHDTNQLELFLAEDINPGLRCLTRLEVLHGVPPGWHSFLCERLLYENYDKELRILCCEEADGHLNLEMEAPDGLDLGYLLDAMVEMASRTCAACGSQNAVRFAAAGQDPHVVCLRCKRRMLSGEAFFHIADEHFVVESRRRSRQSNPSSALSDSAPLPPDELRILIRTIRDQLRQRVVGQDAAVSEIALLFGIHLGGVAPGERGPRLLLVGRTGVGKTTLLDAMRVIAEEHAIAAPYVAALDLTGPGWSGAPSILDCISASLGESKSGFGSVGLQDAMRSRRARKALIIIDELHFIRAADPSAPSFFEKRSEVIGSLLPVVGHGGRLVGGDAPTTFEWSSDEAFVVCAGSFDGLLDMSHDPTIRDLVEKGKIPLELASRFETTIRLAPLAEKDLRSLLSRWPSVESLARTCARLGIDARVTPEAIAMAARAVSQADGRLTPRSAGGWIVSALRRQLTSALDDAATREIVVTPDDLTVERLDAPSDDDADDDGGTRTRKARG